jgi:porin
VKDAIMARMLLLSLCGLLVATAGAGAQAPDTGAQAPDTVAPAAPDVTAESAATTPAGDGGARGTAPISGNPGAVNIVTGTGRLGEILLGVDKDSGIRLGGLWLGDANWLATGGLQPGQWALNSLTLVDLNLDAEKLWGCQGGMLGIEFLQLTGQATNVLAGAVPGYNSLDGPPPLTRQELYELWWRQSFFDDKLVVRIGKTVPTYDFNNVIRPVPTGDPAATIPAVSGLIYTPIFVNPTILGKLPGYYNSAFGVTTTLAPTKDLYVSYGFFDGNLANGTQTGLRGPQFNGYYFHIGEIGHSWLLGPDKKPGMSAVGIWGQTGLLRGPAGTEEGACGVYVFGSQRLWFRNPGIDNSGVSGFYQLGANDTDTASVRQFFGTGLTAFGLTPCRKNDSMGLGLAWSWLNDAPNAGTFFFPDPALDSTALGPSELMLQAYYQANIRDGLYFQPTLSYIPTPGARPDIPDALAVTVRLTVLF